MVRPVVGVLLALAALACLGALAHEAEAAHFRGGTLHAERTENPNEIRFGGTVTMSRSYFSPMPNVGDEFYISAIETGDGNWVAFALKATQINVIQDWVQGDIVTPLGGPAGVVYTYASPTNGGLPWQPWWGDCCRFVDASPNHHANNPSAPWRLETIVNAANQPPKPTLPPIVMCSAWSLCLIEIPYVDADPDDVVSMRFATPAEATGGTFNQPGPVFPGGTCPSPLSLGTLPAGSTCILPGPPGGASYLAWNTFGAMLYTPEPAERSFYSAQVVLEDHLMLMANPAKTKVPLDFLIRLTAITPPVWKDYSPCDANPAFVGHGNLKVYAGATLNFQLKAEGYLANTTTIDTGRTLQLSSWSPSLPSGMTMTLGPGTNPVQASLVYTPAASLAGTSLSVPFFVQDLDGISALVNCVVNIDVLAVPTITAQVVYTDLPYGVSCGDSHSDQHGYTLDSVLFLGALSMTPTGPLQQEYNWTFGDTGAPGNGITALTGSHTYDDPGNYTASVVARHRFFDVYEWTTWTHLPDDLGLSFLVTILNRCPEPVFEPAIADGRYLAIDEASYDLDGDVVAWAWDFGDGSPASSEVSPLHTYARQGFFAVCLTVTDDDNASGRLCHYVRVRFGLESATDSDNDGVQDAQDNCPEADNGIQADRDGDGLGDVCDDAPDTPGTTVLYSRDGPLPPILAAIDDRIDTDRDGIEDVADNCPVVANADQHDLDGDLDGDVCDPDADGDLVPESPVVGRGDNCATVPNAAQRDDDADGVGDACEPAFLAGDSSAAAGIRGGDASAARCADCAGAASVASAGDGSVALTAGGLAAALLVGLVAAVGLVLAALRRWR